MAQTDPRSDEQILAALRDNVALLARILTNAPELCRIVERDLAEGPAADAVARARGHVEAALATAAPVIVAVRAEYAPDAAPAGRVH